MSTVIIEPAVIAVPKAHPAVEEVTKYVDLLMEWADALRTQAVSVRLGQNTTQELFDADAFPYVQRFERLIEFAGIESFDAATIAKVVTGLLELTPSLERASGIDDVLISEFASSPAISPVAEFEESRRRSFAFAVLAAGGFASERPYAVVTSSANSPHIACSFTLQDIDSSAELRPPIPSRQEAQVRVLSGPTELLRDVDTVAAICTATTSEQATRAIQIELLRSLGGSVAVIRQKAFRLHAEFVGTIRSTGTSNQPGRARRLLSAIADVLLEQRLDQTHPLRQNASGGSGQRCRGRDKAWRRDIDYEYHLHYWECADGSVEICTIGVHNDFGIPE